MNYPLYQKTLCPDVWDGKNLKPEVRTALLKIATDFIDELAKDHELKIDVDDILFIGSLTNYNWTAYSDIDIHISADYSKLVMPPEDAQIMFDAIKAGWNRSHNITIKKHDVEIYVQDIHDKQTSAAEYSLKQGKWLKEPVFNAPTFNKELIKTKFKEYQTNIKALLAKHDEDGLRRLLDKLYKFRRAGLNAGGELSEENIVFKILRSSGLLEKVKENIDRIYDKKMSVDETLNDSSMRFYEGWWISPTGESVEVENNHAETAEELFSNLYPTASWKYPESPEDSLIEKGWIRACISHDRIILNGPTPKSAQKNAAIKLADERGGEKVTYCHGMFEKVIWASPRAGTLNETYLDGKKLVYHIGHGKNHDAIMRGGFIPNSPTMGDVKDDEGVYFFPNSMALEDAWDAWLEDKFDDNEQIICYIVDIHGLMYHEGGDYEIIVKENVPPDRIVSWKDLNPSEPLHEVWKNPLHKK